jgi:hypothetical protein
MQNNEWENRRTTDDNDSEEEGERTNEKKKIRKETRKKLDSSKRPAVVIRGYAHVYICLLCTLLTWTRAYISASRLLI